MTNQNNNIAATIVPTESRRELLQDIYGGGGIFTLVHQTKEYNIGDTIVDEDMTQMPPLNAGILIMHFYEKIASISRKHIAFSFQDWSFQGFYARQFENPNNSRNLGFVGFDPDTHLISDIEARFDGASGSFSQASVIFQVYSINAI